MVDEHCGILVDPTTKAGFIQGFSDAMLKLASSPELSAQMGAAGVERVKTNYFDWKSKCDAVVEVFHKTLEAKK